MPDQKNTTHSKFADGLLDRIPLERIVSDAIALEPIKVLVVEDSDAQNGFSLRPILNKPAFNRFKLRQADQLGEALLLLVQEDFDLILLDLFLPDSQGLDTFLQVYEHTPEIPVVIATDLDNKALAIEVIREGAQDFLVKRDLGGDRLERALLYAVERSRYRTVLHNLSLRDELTGLLNRRGFLSLASQHLKIAQRSGWKIMLLFADLDGLKTINDNFGHPEGDKALRGVAGILTKTFRGSDLLARLGGDEFITLALNVTERGVEAILKRLREKVRDYNVQSRRYQISLSFGVAQFGPEEQLPLDEMIAQADKALYRDKQKSFPKREKDPRLPRSSTPN
jgi:two-component system cell cycle response regulator